MMNGHCRYCGHDDTDPDPITGVVECQGCGATWTAEAVWQHYCTECSLYIDYATKCKPGCSQREGAPNWAREVT